MKDGCDCIVNGYQIQCKAKAVPPPPSSPAAADKVTCHNTTEAGSQANPDAGGKRSKQNQEDLFEVRFDP